jgi:hypothetical protein
VRLQGRQSAHRPSTARLIDADGVIRYKDERLDNVWEKLVTEALKADKRANDAFPHPSSLRQEGCVYPGKRSNFRTPKQDAECKKRPEFSLKCLGQATGKLPDREEGQQNMSDRTIPPASATSASADTVKLSKRPTCLAVHASSRASPYSVSLTDAR